jgi:hypothetical protein
MNKKVSPTWHKCQSETIFELMPLNDDFATVQSSGTHVLIVGTMVEHRKLGAQDE